MLIPIVTVFDPDKTYHFGPLFFVLNTYVLKLSRENFMMWTKEPLQQKNTPPPPKRETAIKIVVSTSTVYLLPTYKD